MQKTFKKGLSLLLTLVLAVGMVAVGLPGLVTIARADTWDGTYNQNTGFSNSGNNYYISSARGLTYFVYTVGQGTSYSGKTIYLQTDVNLNNIDFGNNVFPYNTGRNFEGTFDGQNHTISNFKMTHSNHRVAMFRQAKNATFRNLYFEGVHIDDSSDSNKKNGFAVLVGYTENPLTFDNIHINSGNIYGYNYAGSLVGEVKNGNPITISNCSNNATINILNVGAGGFVGYYDTDNHITFSNCTNTASVHSGGDRAGGLIGHCKGYIDATDCSNTGTITAGSSDAGGIVGWIQDDTSNFIRCSNTGNVTTTAAAGGIVGYFGDNDAVIQFQNCSNTGAIYSSSDRAGGIIGHIVSDATHIFSGNVNRGTVYGKVDAGGICGSNEGAGTWSDNYNYANVSCNDDNAGGILGEVQDDANSFLRCYNVGDVTGVNSVGGILGYGNAAAHTFTSCGNSGTITSTGDCAAGIYGYGGNSNPVCTECWNIGNIYAYHDAGGIIGKTSYHSVALRCFNAGNIGTYNNNGGSYHGGITGYTGNYTNASASNAQIEDCYNWGNVSGGSLNAGIVAYVVKGDTNLFGGGGNRNYYIKNCYSTGNVSGGTAKAMVCDGGSGADNCYKTIDPGNGWGTLKSDAEMTAYSNFTLSSNYCKNTWGVKIGNTTYYYPILTWYRNMFTFTSVFQDTPTNTNTTIEKTVYNNTFTTPNPTRTGYTIGAWFNTANNAQTLTPGATVTAGVTNPMHQYVVEQSFAELTQITNTTTYNLTWTAHHYTVTFDGNGATSGSMNPQGFTYDQAQALTANAFYRDYTVTYHYNDDVTANTTATASATFNGWATSANGAKVYNDQQSVNNLTATDGGNVPLYANWTLASVTLPTPTKEGYTFGGWYSDDETFQTLVGAAGASYTPTANITLYAKWSINQYTITYVTDGGSTVAQDAVDYGAALPAGRTTAKEGHTFNGWVYTGNNTTYTGSTMPAYDLTATAQWTVNQYTITYVTGDGEAVATEQVNYGAALPSRTSTLENANFDGWVYTGNNATYTGSTMPAYDLVATAKWVFPTADDTYVLDYGLPAALNVVSNDPCRNEATFELDSVSQDTGFTTEIENGTIRFTPTTALNAPVSFTYTVTYNSAPYTGEVTVIPANSVYYEETFFTFADGNKPGEKLDATWQWTTGSAYDKVQEGAHPGSETSPVYGFDNAYTDNGMTYSLGRAQYAEVSASHKGGATASFTFTGTGFDFYALTDNQSGLAFVDVYKQNANVTGGWENIESTMVNTYFGYKYGRLYLDANNKVTLTETSTPIYFAPAGQTADTFFIEGTIRGWRTPTYYDTNGTIVTGTTSDETKIAYAYGWVAGENTGVSGVYQVPVISRTGLDYGTYKVVIEPRWSARQNMTGGTSYKFYVDAVRVYDPINPADISGAAYDAYQTRGELSASYQSVRDLLITADSLGNTGGHGNAGIAFLEQGKGETLKDYKSAGPKNEVYLNPGQAIAFNLTTASTVQPAKLSLGLREIQPGANNAASKVTVYSKDTSNGTEITTISGATELYRDIGAAVDWQLTSGSNYTTSAPIIIVNTGAGVISITKLKWSYNQIVSTPNTMLSFSFAPQDLVTTSAVLRQAAADAVAPDASGVRLQWNTTTIRRGGVATLTITAPSNFEKAYVNGAEVAGYTENADGTRTWRYTYTSSLVGKHAFDVQLADAGGYRTKAIAAENIDVVAATNGQKTITLRTLLEMIFGNFFRALQEIFRR